MFTGKTLKYDSWLEYVINGRDLHLATLTTGYNPLKRCSHLSAIAPRRLKIHQKLWWTIFSHSDMFVNYLKLVALLAKRLVQGNPLLFETIIIKFGYDCGCIWLFIVVIFPFSRAPIHPPPTPPAPLINLPQLSDAISTPSCIMNAKHLLIPIC